MKQHERIPLEEQPILGQQERLPFFATPAGRTISALLMIVIVGLVLIMSQGSGAVSYEMDDMQLAVAGPDKSPVFLPYSSIQAVRLVSDFTLGHAVAATDWNDGWCGQYENEDIGLFTLYAYSSGSYIVVEHADGVLIFSMKTQKATQKAYQELLAKVS